jgi:hypothetical protein
MTFSKTVEKDASKEIGLKLNTKFLYSFFKKSLYL